jgi:hypothetical protein
VLVMTPSSSRSLPRFVTTPSKFISARAPKSAREGACAPRRVSGQWSVVRGQRPQMGEST